jgi:predicted lipoprotein with Yx(FWY)xxD motif
VKLKTSSKSEQKEWRYLMKHMNLLRVRPGVVGVLIVLSLITSACYSTAAAQNPASTSPAIQNPTSTSTSAEGATVKAVDNPEYGQILVTPDGMTLYTNSVDTPEALKCTNVGCTGFWPPFIVNAQPTADEGITGKLGTVSRPDGSLQLTYNQQPLYTFYLDKQPGDEKGDGFKDLGGTWHVVGVGSAAGDSSDNSDDSESGSGGIQY